VKLPKVVSQDDWVAARKRLLVKEKEFTRQRDALSAERRKLPMVAIEKEYVFQGPEGRRTLADLFDGKRQLLTYHFMFGPDWGKTVPLLLIRRRQLRGQPRAPRRRDTAFAVISRAPFEKINPSSGAWAGRFHGCRRSGPTSITTSGDARRDAYHLQLRAGLLPTEGRPHEGDGKG